MRRFAVPLAVLLCLVPSVGWLGSATGQSRRPERRGIGDPYFPNDGNGGYDVQPLRPATSRTSPTTDVLMARRRSPRPRPSSLSRFNLDLRRAEGPTPSRVNGAAAKWHRSSKGELVITPASPLPERRLVHRPSSSTTASPARSRTTSSAAGSRPMTAWSWRGNRMAPRPGSRPTTIRSTRPRSRSTSSVPAGLEVVANGRLESSDDGGRSDDVDLGRRRADGDLPRHDQCRRVRPRRVLGGRHRLLGRHRPRPVRPGRRSPNRHAVRDLAGRPTCRTSAWRARSACRPAARSCRSGSTASTEFPWDFVFVEIHTVGQDDWTTLQDLNGHTTPGHRVRLPVLAGHPPVPDPLPDRDAARAATRRAPAATGGRPPATAATPRHWAFDLGAYAGSRRRGLDLLRERRRRPAQPVSSSTTSSCRPARARPRSRPTATRWTAGRSPARPRAAPATTTTGSSGRPRTSRHRRASIAAGSFARQPEIIDFLGRTFGPYPFSTGGGIVDDVEGLGFALETQTRPVYARDFFTDSISGDSRRRPRDRPPVVRRQPRAGALAAHLAQRGLRDSYAEWLWSEDQGLGTAQEIFDFWYEVVPGRRPVLERRHRRSGSGSAVRLRGLHPRRR